MEKSEPLEPLAFRQDRPTPSRPSTPPADPHDSELELGWTPPSDLYSSVHLFGATFIKECSAILDFPPNVCHAAQKAFHRYLGWALTEAQPGHFDIRIACLTSLLLVAKFTEHPVSLKRIIQTGFMIYQVDSEDQADCPRHPNDSFQHRKRAVG